MTTSDDDLARIREELGRTVTNRVALVEYQRAQATDVAQRCGWGDPRRAAREMAPHYQKASHIYAVLAEDLALLGSATGEQPALPVAMHAAQLLVAPDEGRAVSVAWGTIGTTVVWRTTILRTPYHRDGVWMVLAIPDEPVRHQTWQAARSDALTRALGRYMTMMTGGQQ